MAQVPNSEGVPSVAADTRTPDDYQHINATPSSFGGLIAQGEEKAGQGIEQTSSNLFNINSFYDKITTDDQINHVMTGSLAIRKGDPNKTIIGPDGQPQPDTGYLGTAGRTALDQRPQAEASLDNLIAAARSNLKSPQQQLQFDEQTRRLRSYWFDEIGTHADTQMKTYASGVNNSGASHALNGIAAEPDNPVAMANNASDLINFRVQEAQLKYGDTPEIKTQAIAGAKAEALKAQVESISIKDPSRAMSILDKNRNIAGTLYEPLAKQFQARAEQQNGITAGTAAIKSTYDAVPPAATFMPAVDSVGQKYGISGTYLLRTAQIESGGNPNAVSSTGAAGPFQFTKGTAAQYGLNNRFDFGASLDAAAKLASDNKAALTPVLGRPPTDAELYLAHQQGAQGAAKLLANPTLRAGDVVGDKAIAVNGGDPNAPAAAFTSMWTAKFNGAAGAMAQSRKASAYQIIASDAGLSEQARQHAFQFVNQTIAAQQIAEEADQRGKKLASDNAANTYVTQMLNNQPVNMTAIANDQNLTWEAKEALSRAVEAHGGSDVEQAQRHYGPGFWPAYKAIMAPADDPSRISDISQLLGRAGPNGDLTLTGVQKLNEVITQSRKSVNDQAVNTSKVGMMNYAKSQLSFEQDMGPIKIHDPKGEAAFNATFIPKFEAAYDKWVNKDGKSPWEFLTKDNVDKMIQGIRPKAQMAQDRMTAFGGATGEEPANTPLPPAPDGVDSKVWNGIISAPPVAASGQIPSHQVYGKAVEILKNNPTPEVQARFDKLFGADKAKAQDILGKLNPAQAPTVAAPTVATPAQVQSATQPAVAAATKTAHENPEMDQAIRDRSTLNATRREYVKEGLSAIAEGRAADFTVPVEQPDHGWLKAQQLLVQGMKSAADTFEMPNMSIHDQMVKWHQDWSDKQSRDLIEANIAGLDAQQKAAESLPHDSPVYAMQTSRLARQRKFMELQLADLTKPVEASK